MKYLTAFLVVFIVFWSCEEDDICTEDKSPRMYLKFENLIAEDSVQLDSLFIWRENTENQFELYVARRNSAPADSILVPLPLHEVNQTSFILSPDRMVVTSYDTLTITYERQLEFGSKACGYKVTYLNAEYVLTNHFFVASEAIDTNITDEETPDLLLYY